MSGKGCCGRGMGGGGARRGLRRPIPRSRPKSPPAPTPDAPTITLLPSVKTQEKQTDGEA